MRWHQPLPIQSYSRFFCDFRNENFWLPPVGDAHPINRPIPRSAAPFQNALELIGALRTKSAKLRRSGACRSRSSPAISRESRLPLIKQLQRFLSNGARCRCGLCEVCHRGGQNSVPPRGGRHFPIVLQGGLRELVVVGMPAIAGQLTACAGNKPVRGAAVLQVVQCLASAGDAIVWQFGGLCCKVRLVGDLSA